MSGKRYLLVVLAVWALAGCAKYKDISLDHIAFTKFNMTSLSTARVTIKAAVDNPVGKKIALQGLEGVLKVDKKPFAQFHLDSTLVFAAKSISEQEGVLILRIRDMSPLFSGVIDLDETILEKLSLDLEMTVKSGCMKRTLKEYDVPIKEFIK
ncbi:MAG: hypothetical protein RBR62_06525 [Bacteroidales bacterium]|jgi:hypothetical protein|nr:hypothetical protein [Bacteroidales bacterium]